MKIINFRLKKKFKLQNYKTKKKKLSGKNVDSRTGEKTN